MSGKLGYVALALALGCGSAAESGSLAAGGAAGSAGSDAGGGSAGGAGPTSGTGPAGAGTGGAGGGAVGGGGAGGSPSGGVAPIGEITGTEGVWEPMLRWPKDTKPHSGEGILVDPVRPSDFYYFYQTPHLNPTDWPMFAPPDDAAWWGGVPPFGAAASSDGKRSVIIRAQYSELTNNALPLITNGEI